MVKSRMCTLTRITRQDQCSSVSLRHAARRRARPPCTGGGSQARSSQRSSAIGTTAAEFTTSSLDGKVGFWTRDEITAAMSQMEIS